MRLDNTSRAFSTIRWECDIISFIVTCRKTHTLAHAHTHPRTEKPQQNHTFAILAISSSEKHLHTCINPCMPFIKYIIMCVWSEGGELVEMACHLYVILWHLNLRIASALFYSFIHFHTRTYMCVVNVCVAMSILASRKYFFMVISLAFNQPPIPMEFQVQTLSIWTE